MVVLNTGAYSNTGGQTSTASFTAQDSDLTRFGVAHIRKHEDRKELGLDATGMCGACMVPVSIDGKLVRKHACIDGPEIDSHIIDWDKFIPRFQQFKAQENRVDDSTDPS